MSLADGPEGPAAPRIAPAGAPETSVSVRLVRKFGPWNAPENVTGNRGLAAAKTSMPFIPKPYVPSAEVE